MSAKQAINDKLQGSVAYLMCGGVVNNQIKKGLLLNVSEKNEIGEYLAKLQATAWLSHALCAPDQHTANRRRKSVAADGTDRRHGRTDSRPLHRPCSAYEQTLRTINPKLNHFLHERRATRNRK